MIFDAGRNCAMLIKARSCKLVGNRISKTLTPDSTELSVLARMSQRYIVASGGAARRLHVDGLTFDHLHTNVSCLD